MLCSRVPLYQAMYSTMAWQAAARVGQAWVSMSSPERGEEAFGHGVVPALALTPDGQGDLAVLGEVRVGGGGVLPRQPRSEWKITPG